MVQCSGDRSYVIHDIPLEAKLRFLKNRLRYRSTARTSVIRMHGKEARPPMLAVIKSVFLQFSQFYVTVAAAAYAAQTFCKASVKHRYLFLNPFCRKKHTFFTVLQNCFPLHLCYAGLVYCFRFKHCSIFVFARLCFLLCVL